MSISSNYYIDSAVHKITSNHLQEGKEDSNNQVDDAIFQELGLSEDQRVVMRSIEMHSPALLNDIILQYKYDA